MLLLSIYTNACSAALDGLLRQAQVGVICFLNHNGGPLMPTTLAEVEQLIGDLKAHATNPLLVATAIFANPDIVLTTLNHNPQPQAFWEKSPLSPSTCASRGFLKPSCSRSASPVAASDTTRGSIFSRSCSATR